MSFLPPSFCLFLLRFRLSSFVGLHRTSTCPIILFCLLFCLWLFLFLFSFNTLVTECPGCGRCRNPWNSSSFSSLPKGKERRKGRIVVYCCLPSAVNRHKIAMWVVRLWFYVCGLQCGLYVCGFCCVWLLSFIVCPKAYWATPVYWNKANNFEMHLLDDIATIVGNTNLQYKHTTNKHVKKNNTQLSQKRSRFAWVSLATTDQSCLVDVFWVNL